MYQEPGTSTVNIRRPYILCTRVLVLVPLPGTPLVYSTHKIHRRGERIKKGLQPLFRYIGRGLHRVHISGASLRCLTAEVPTAGSFSNRGGASGYKAVQAFYRQVELVCIV